MLLTNEVFIFIGGLNDILNEIKVSAIDHHIPCVFALSRKVLGKVCRKPVPVSCVGVFNYEGSEVCPIFSSLLLPIIYFIHVQIQLNLIDMKIK